MLGLVLFGVILYLVFAVWPDWLKDLLGRKKVFVGALLNGLTLASLYFLVASGFTLVFGLMRNVNLAHGSMFLLGGYIGYEAARLTGNWYIGSVAAFLALAIIGALMQVLVFQRIQGDDMRQTLVTIGISIVAANLMLAAWTGQTYQFEPGVNVPLLFALVFAPAGGVGRLLVEMAKAKGARVYGATSSPDKVSIAKAAGAEQVIVPGEQSLEDQIMALTQNQGVDVVYDAVGRDTFDHSVAALKNCGHLVSFGQASGDIGKKDIGALAGKSITLSRPNYGHYTDTAKKVGEATSAVWDALKKREISVQIGQRFELAQAADAHRMLEARQTTGSTLLLPTPFSESGIS